MIENELSLGGADGTAVSKSGKPRVLMVVPGREEDRTVMVFARRQIEAIESTNAVVVKRFFLGSRTSLRQFISALYAFRAAESAFKPDLVHAHFGTATGLFTTLASASPVVVTFRGSDLNPYYRNWRRNLREMWLRHLIARGMSHYAAFKAVGIICVSEQLRSQLLSRELRERAIVCPVGVKLDLFAPMDRELARSKLNWHHNDNVVVFHAGRTPHTKRRDLARAAVSVAQRSLRNLRLVELDGNVDPQTIPTILNAADCLLMTSDFEGSPNIVKEAIACNLPVVSTAVGDVPERLKNVALSYVTNGTAEALSIPLVNIVRAGRRSDGRVFAEAELDEDKLAAVIVAYYHDILSTRAQRA